MQKAVVYQDTLFPELTAEFPSTRYQGSKVKLVDWIREQIAELDFTTCLDAFGGTGAVAYRLKQAGKQVTYNDLLCFNYYFVSCRWSRTSPSYFKRSGALPATDQAAVMPKTSVRSEMFRP
ncbi:MAG: hypothetical protein CVU38_08900 [Chloroflexi bacterium HGW-Chloroflexi-1]|nr:MAG: hypothetical protein CVU38_08900 [Chloroflexi bacterium HGW-Chloroflexi-1]